MLSNFIGLMIIGCRVQVEELERQIADEKKKFQVVAERLAEQQIEADINAQQMQDDWDGKIRELQKEKYALSIRLQVCFRKNQYLIVAPRQVNCANEVEPAMLLLNICLHEVIILEVLMNHMKYLYSQNREIAYFFRRVNCDL